MSGRNLILDSSYDEIPQRIEWKTVLRILGFLQHNGKSKKTHVSMMCNLGYKRCIQYLNWLEMMNLIKKDIDENGSHLISVNEFGIELAIKFSK